MKPVTRPQISRELVERINREEVRHKGKIVAIEPETGEYFIGGTTMEALKKARQRFPSGAFVFKRIGCRWTHRQGGGFRRSVRS